MNANGHPEVAARSGASRKLPPAADALREVLTVPGWLWISFGTFHRLAARLAPHLDGEQLEQFFHEATPRHLPRSAWQALAGAARARCRHLNEAAR